MVRIIFIFVFLISQIQSSYAFWGALIGVDVGIQILNSVINGSNNNKSNKTNNSTSKNYNSSDRYFYCQNNQTGIIIKVYSSKLSCSNGYTIATKSNYDKQIALNEFNSGKKCEWNIFQNKNVCTNNSTQSNTNSSNKSSVNDYYLAPYFKYVNVDNLRVRSSPNGNVIGTYSLNTKLGVYSDYSQKDGYTWVKVADIQGNIGWVANNFLSNTTIRIVENKSTQECNWDIFQNSSDCTTLSTNVLQNQNQSSVNKNDKEIIKKNETAEVDIDINQLIDQNNLERDIAPPTVILDKNIFITNEELVTITGKVTDTSDIIALIVGNEKVSINSDGTFSGKIFIPIGKNSIQIFAVDSWQNVANHIVNVERTYNINNLIVKDEFKSLNPIRIKSKLDTNKIAIVIGVKDYKDIPNTKYSDNDAAYFIDYATNVFGVPKSNIKTLINDSASTLDLYDLDIWLQNKIRNNTNVYVFYSGHGITINNKSYILPYDFRTSQIERSALDKQAFLKSILRYEPEHVFAFFDACFTGQTRDGKEVLIASAKNINIAVEDSAQPNLTIFNSSENAEFSTDFDQAKHGLFSYYLMLGLEGEADLNKDQNITTNELFTFIRQNVSQTALSLGINQNPTLVSNSENILVQW